MATSPRNARPGQARRLLRPTGHERTVLTAEHPTRRRRERRFLTGGALFAAAMVAANGGNYALNVALSRWMPPAAFADASLMVALMLVATTAAGAFQLAAARVVASSLAAGEPTAAAAARGRFNRLAAAGGLVLFVIFVAGAGLWSRFFGTASPVPFIVLGAGLPLYLLQAVERGVLQGSLDLRSLGMTLVVEAGVRVGASLALVAIGLGVNGATAGLSLSFAASWVVATAAVRRCHTGPAVHSPGRRSKEGMAGEGVAASTGVMLLLLAGQIVVGNGDLLVVKRFFPAADAAAYAVVALAGRAVFFCSWAVGNAVLPVAARKKRLGEPHGRLLAGAMAAVVAFGVSATTAAYIAGPGLVSGLAAPAFNEAQLLIGPYTGATSLFAVANLLATYRLAVGDRFGAVVLLGAGVAQTLALVRFHTTLSEVVAVQAACMAVVVAVLAIRELRLLRQPVAVSPA